jgi:hypothetical protein
MVEVLCILLDSLTKIGYNDHTFVVGPPQWNRCQAHSFGPGRSFLKNEGLAYQTFPIMQRKRPLHLEGLARGGDKSHHTIQPEWAESLSNMSDVNMIEPSQARSDDKVISDLVDILGRIWIDTWGPRMEDALRWAVRCLVQASRHGPRTTPCSTSIVFLPTVDSAA